MLWFKHDSTAHMDAKLRRVRMKYGLQGYGLYWYLLELTAQSVDVHNLTFELEHDAEIIAHDVGLSRELVQEMMMYMIELHLFEVDAGRVYCRKMLKRMDSSMTSNPKMRQIIQQANKNHDGVMTDHDGVMTPSCKKERKKERIGRMTKPSHEEIAEYIKEKGYSVDPLRFYNHYESNGWRVGKNPMKSWRHALANWNSTDAASKPKERYL